MLIGTEADVRDCLLDRMANIWTAPHGVDEAKALPEYMASLKGRFDRDTLRAGLERLKTSHKYQRWPTIAEVLEACYEARRAIHPDRPAYVPTGARAPGVGNNDWAQDMALSERVMRSDAGQKAIQHGFAHSLWEWTWRFGKEPTDQDLRDIYAEWKRVGASIEQCAKDGIHVFPDGFQIQSGQLAGQMRQRLKSIRDHEAHLAQAYGKAVAA